MLFQQQHRCGLLMLESVCCRSFEGRAIRPSHDEDRRGYTLAAFPKLQGLTLFLSAENSIFSAISQLPPPLLLHQPPSRRGHGPPLRPRASSFDLGSSLRQPLARRGHAPRATCRGGGTRRVHPRPTPAQATRHVPRRRDPTRAPPADARPGHAPPPRLRHVPTPRPRDTPRPDACTPRDVYVPCVVCWIS
jgi:hypothetical protein